MQQIVCEPAKSVLAVAQVFLVFGKSGWIGGLVGQLLKDQGIKYEYATARLEDRAGILADIERVRQNFLFEAVSVVAFQATEGWCFTQVKPTHVLNAAGVTGRPNVDWCEDHKVCFRCSHISTSR